MKTALLFNPRSPFVIFFLIITCSLFSITSSAQSWIWANGEGGIGQDASNSVTVDPYSNTYITGNIAGKADFSGTVYQGHGIYDVFVAKYDPSGNLLWVKLAGGSGNDRGTGIKWNNGFLYVCGAFEDTAIFENTSLISKGESDAFLAKYDDNGNLVWVKSAGGSGLDDASSLDLDGSGNIYVAGGYENAITVGSTNLSTTNIYSESFIAKYDGGGNVIWAQTAKGNQTNMITGIAYDYHTGICVTGYYGGSFKVGTSTVNASSPSYDIFLAKVEQSDGTLDWLKSAGSKYEDGANGICCDKDGNPSIVGYFAGTAYFDSNSVSYFDYNDIFVAHYDASGNNLWVRAGRGHQLDIGFAIAADDNGNLFATGMFQDVTDFDGHLLHAYDRDIFLVSYDKNGSIRWITSAGNLDTDCGLGIAVHANGTIAITGYYLHICSFGNITIDYADGDDLFVAKYHPGAVNGINEPGSDLQISASPNPFHKECFITNADATEKTTYSVYNSIGQVLYKGELNSTEQPPTANWPSGIYFMEVSSPKKTKTIKLVKQ